MAQGAAVILPPDKKDSAAVLGLLGSRMQPLHGSRSRLRNTDKTHPTIGRFALPSRAAGLILKTILMEKLQLLILSDGKPGHENQSVGLAEAMARRVPAEICMIRLTEGKGIFPKTIQALSSPPVSRKPDFIIAAGHSTHLPLLLTARKYGACSILLMKPSLPLSWFDWCIAPEHDFRKSPFPKNVITSKGALNRVLPAASERKGKLCLIGGPSKTHGYEESGLIAQIKSISAGAPWEIADSRRTPATLLPALAAQIPGLTFFPHQETQPGWLASKLANAEEVHVTEDSVSMIYEALSSGAKVRILEMPRLRQDSRVIRGLDMLKSAGYFSSNSPGLLAEADRCAGVILRPAR